MQQQAIKPTVDHWLISAGMVVIDNEDINPPRPEPKPVKKRVTTATKRSARIKKDLLPLLKDGMTNKQAYDHLIPLGKLKNQNGKNLGKERVSNICTGLRRKYELKESPRKGDRITSQPPINTKPVIDQQRLNSKGLNDGH